MPLVDSFGFARDGFVKVFRTQRNFRVQCVLALIAIILGFVLGISAEQWIAVILCMALVLAAECVNTALEAVVDLVSPAYDRLARTAKDCSAAAVLVCSVAALLIGVIVYGGAALRMMGL